MDIIPIWRDYQIVIPSNEEYVDFTINKIKYSGKPTPIYSGRAYKRPGNGAISIVPNEICAPHVSMATANLPLTGEPIDYPMAATFNLTAPNGFLNAWIFSAGWDYLERVAGRGSDPITGIVARDQTVLFSSYRGEVKDGEYYFSKGGEVLYRSTFRYIHPYNVMPLRPWNYPDADKITATNGVSAVEYRIADDVCSNHILFYINAYGGWDSLLVDGTVKKTDDYSRTTFKQAYSTEYIHYPGLDEQPRGTVNLQNDITRKYSLVTGWLTDDQASRMHHLLGSTNVYLLDRITGQYVPVVLTNSSCEYKTFRNQGAKLVNYTIEATVAQNFTRR